MSGRRIGVYICYCGGNISDYVDVEKVRDIIAKEPDVVVAKTVMFACSDASQQIMIEDIKKEKLDALVVASCSPKLHLYTFRGVARRAGLNPYQYIQVNLREQDSWAHTDDYEGATEKAVRLVRAGIAKARYSEPLEPLRIETTPAVLIVGAGIAGLRAALGLSDIGISVYIVEKADKPGGWVADFGRMYPHDNEGKVLIEKLLNDIKRRSNIVMYTNTEVVEKKGSVGDFHVKIKVRDSEAIPLHVGAIIVATGFDSYKPQNGEYGYGLDGVVTLPEFKKLIDSSNGKLVYNGKPVKSIAYIYCVGSREKPNKENAHQYCSRFCCNATIHSSLMVNEKYPDVVQFHLYRDMRTYGKYELMYEKARRNGSIFLRFSEDSPPEVLSDGGSLKVRVKDTLTDNEEIEIHPDLVVLVTGMVPRPNDRLVEILKLPVGRDGFFNEIHPKLRPVETVMDGVFICGASQGPKNSVEAVASALAAVTKSAGLLKKGYVELEPTVAHVNEELCEWCGECEKACPYEAVEKISKNGKEVARINPALCKGCGACVPVCERDALDVKGYTDRQIRAMIDGLVKEVVLK